MVDNNLSIVENVFNRLHLNKRDKAPVFKSGVVILLILLFTCLYILLSVSTYNTSPTTASSPEHIHTVQYFHPPTKEAPNLDLDSGYKRRLPQCLIAGVRKAGTAALRGYLDIHPDVVIAQGEKHFFSSSSQYRKGLSYYRRQMPKSTSKQITIEKTPAYYMQEKNARRIKEMNASIRIILVMREPLSRAVSEYVQWDLLEGKDKPFEHYAVKRDGSVNSHNPRLRLSRYYYLSKQWLQIFPREQILFVNGDNLSKDPVTELKKVETFLGLKPYITQDNFFLNEDTGFLCFRRWDKSEKCLSSSKGRPHPTLDPEVQEQLTEYFRPYNRKFFDLICDDFGWPT